MGGGDGISESAHRQRWGRGAVAGMAGMASPLHE